MAKTPPRDPDKIGEALTALAHPLRRQILTLISQGAKSSPELVAALGSDATMLGYHLRILRHGGIVRAVRRRPRGVIYERNLQLLAEIQSIVAAISHD